MAKVEVDEELKDILPGFLNNREKDIETLKTAVAANDFATLQKVGHKVSGSSGGYGFDELGAIAKNIELAARESSLEKVQALVQEFENYVREIEVVFV
ncbi:Hpt domain-containing protein [Bacteriovorax sp. DB6_IX]|uniref:Hpt domain-containing protein n=1 Tax=Bacteriovorax sp. DB6_IX TaxID=1353530 RepID=UPI000389F66A|nr:Hpt domain-containing protein [Bacteriovorax sp. DB6_IX]EQC51543.1 Hpt domain protein [Bacteriovorax sp. DB6_IX]